MTKQVLIIGLLIAFAKFTLAQTLEPIAADRPDQTETPCLTPRNYIQAEIGVLSEHFKSSKHELTIPTMFVKYGVSEYFECRLIIENVLERNNKSMGIMPILIGFKSKLIEEKGIIPKASFIGHISLPNVASDGNRAQNVAPEFRFTMQHTLSKIMSLGYNLGMEWDGNTTEASYIYTLTSGFSLSSKLSAYIEFYGDKTRHTNFNHNFDAGFCFLINHNSQLDVSSGFQLKQEMPSYFFSMGYSFRIQTK